MSLIFATQLTAVATTALAVLAIVTAWYARKAFRKQSREVSDQAQMLKVQSGQLELQSQQLNDQREINALQTEDLRESLKERARLRQDAEREQADKIGLRMSYIPFPDYSLEYVDGFKVSPGEQVHMAVVSNDSRRPIQHVVCKYGGSTAVIIGRLVDDSDAPGEQPDLIQPIPLSSAQVIRTGETYGFAFEINSHRVPIGGHGEARFTDDAGLHWQLDDDLHLEEVPNRDW
jgi:hypothetical protein